MQETSTAIEKQTRQKERIFAKIKGGIKKYNTEKKIHTGIQSA